MYRSVNTPTHYHHTHSTIMSQPCESADRFQLNAYGLGYLYVFLYDNECESHQTPERFTTQEALVKLANTPKLDRFDKREKYSILPVSEAPDGRLVITYEALQKFIGATGVPPKPLLPNSPLDHVAVLFRLPNLTKRGGRYAAGTDFNEVLKRSEFVQNAVVKMQSPVSYRNAHTEPMDMATVVSYRNPTPIYEPLDVAKLEPLAKNENQEHEWEDFLDTPATAWHDPMEDAWNLEADETWDHRPYRQQTTNSHLDSSTPMIPLKPSNRIPGQQPPRTSSSANGIIY